MLVYSKLYKYSFFHSGELFAVVALIYSHVTIALPLDTDS